MQVDRNIQVLQALPKRQIHVLVEIVGVGLPIDERALEAKLLDGTLEFRRGGAGILRWKTGEARIALRPASALHAPAGRRLPVPAGSPWSYPQLPAHPA